MSKHIDRRLFLKGLSAAGFGLASRFFDSPVARGATTTAPVRVLFLPIQHGWGRNESFGSITGSEFSFTLPSPLNALNPIKDRCVFVDGLRGTQWGNAHDVSYSDIFTSAVPWGENDSSQLGPHFPEPMGPSLDWVIGRHHQKQVLRVSAGYASWGRPTQPLCFNDNAQEQASFSRAQTAYDAIIQPLRDATIDPPSVPPGQVAVKDRLFAFLGRDADRMLQKLRGSEQQRLESYIQAMNSLGDRITAAPSSLPGLKPSDIPARPTSNPAYEAELQHGFDLMRVAFQADTHRVGVLGVGGNVTNWPWIDSTGQPQVGNIWGSDFHHEVAHYGSVDPRLAFEGWCAWHFRKVIEFAQSLEATPDVDGRTLLDNTLIVLTGEVENGPHDRRAKMHIIIGGGGGIRQGRWIRTSRVPARNRNGAFIGGQDRSGNIIVADVNYGPDFSLHHEADLWTSIARLAGVPLNHFGFLANNLSPINLL
jgi:hypothetical protein